MIHTPILPQEIQDAFWLTPDIYSMAMDHGALIASYFDAEDPTRRLRLHNLSDVVSFSVTLALGWPIRPVDKVAEQTDSICDDLWYAWEEVFAQADQLVQQCVSDMSNSATLGDRVLDQIHSRLRAAISARDDLSVERKRVLEKHVNVVLHLIRNITATCSIPDDRISPRRSALHGKIGSGGDSGRGAAILTHLQERATTTPKVRAAIQASDEVGTTLAERFGVTT